MIYLLTAIVLSPGGSNTHLHTKNIQNNTKQTIHRTTQQLDECGPCPVLASYTLTFALQPKKNHGKTLLIRRSFQISGRGTGNIS